MTKQPQTLSLYRPHSRVTLSCPAGSSRAKQSFVAECDIRNIMAQFEKTGVVKHVKDRPGEYADLPTMDDFHTAMVQVTAAQASFDTLPSHIRTRFGNDPAAFLDFVHDDANTAEMIKMGLLPPSRPEPTPRPAEAVGEPSSETSEEG